MTDIYTSITSLLVSILLFTSTRAQNSLQELQSCLGPLSTYLVTDSYTYNTANPYYKFSWLQTGNRIRTVKIPMGVLMVQDISTIPTAVNCARTLGIQAVVRSGGHSFEGQSGVSNGLVIDISSCNNILSVSENPIGSGKFYATFEAGTRLGKLMKDLWVMGEYYPNIGPSPQIGVGGFMSGGGKGYATRMFGLSADTVTSMDVVLADGSQVVANANTNPDLFWALRGGGAGSFGIVQRFTMEVYPSSQLPHHSMFFIRYGESSDFLNIWQTFFVVAPKELGSYLRWQVGNSLILGHYFGPMATLKAMLQASGALDNTKYPSFQWVVYGECDGYTSRTFECCGDFTCSKTDSIIAPNSVPVETNGKDTSKTKSEIMQNPFPSAVLDQIVAHMKVAPITGAYLVMVAIGNKGLTNPGPMGLLGPTDTPFPSRSETLYVIQYALPSCTSDVYFPGSAAYNWIQKMVSIMAPYTSGYHYQNFADLELTNYGEGYYGLENFKRLIAIKNVYDPNNFFRNDQSIPLVYSEPVTITPTIKPSSQPVTQAPLYADGFSYVGCYKDTITVRAMPNGGNHYSSILDCKAYALTNGFNYFGTEWYNGPAVGKFECWVSNDLTAAKQFGLDATGCVLDSNGIYLMGKGGFLALYSLPAITTRSPTAAVVTTSLPTTKPTTSSPSTSSAGTVSSLKVCLGNKLSNQLVTPDYSFSSDVYYKYSWLKTGNRNPQTIPRNPVGILFANSSSDVELAVKCAIANGFPPVPRSGGHSYEALSSMSGSLVIDLCWMNRLIGVAEVPIGSGNFVGTIQPGMRNGRLYLELDKAGGFHFPSGTSPGAGVGGLVTGGGRGMTVRKYGMAMDSVVSLTAVLADGSSVVASPTSYSDLYWAMLGGGGASFAIMTSLNVKLYKNPLNSLAFLRYSLGADYFDIFQTTLADLPIEYSTSCRIESTNSYVIINYLGPLADLQKVIQDSGLTRSPFFQWMKTSSCSNLGARSFACCGDFDCKNAAAIFAESSQPVERVVKDYEKSKSEIFFDPIPLPVLNQAVTLLATGPRPDVYFDCYMSNGAVVNSRKPTDTPYPARKAGRTVFMCEYSVPSANNGADYYPGSPLYVWLHKFEDLLHPYTTGYKYYNYADLELTNFGQAYWGDENYKRLIQIKQKYDPNNWFRSAQSVPLTYSYDATADASSVKYVGCYKDTVTVRAMPNGGNHYSSILDCKAYALTNGFNYFGTESYNGQFECWFSNDLTAAKQFGLDATGCVLDSNGIYLMGKGGFLALYSLPTITTRSPTAVVTRAPTIKPSSQPVTQAPLYTDVISYVGCYKDTVTVRAMPFGGNLLGSILDCKALAVTKGYIYFGTESYNGQFECWFSNDLATATQFGFDATGCVLDSNGKYLMGKGGFLALYLVATDTPVVGKNYILMLKNHIQHNL